MTSSKDDFDWKSAEIDVEHYGGDIDMLSRHNEKERDSYLRELDLDPNYYKHKSGSGSSSSGSEGCYVATCVYGSYDCPEVWTLRRYRDYTLASSWYGRAFIHVYYTISPILVRRFGKERWFRAFWKPFLDHKVNSLNRQGVEATPYRD